MSKEEIANCTYIFLAQGIGFAPSIKVDIQDLRYDTLEFIRKLEWKAFYHQMQSASNLNMDTATNPDSNSTDTSTSKRYVAKHSDIRVSNFSQAPFQHPLMDKLKLKLLGWIAEHKPIKLTDRHTEKYRIL